MDGVRTPTLPRFVWIQDMLRFTRLQFLSALFGIAVFAILAATRIFEIPGVPRYDLILVLCIGVQAWMVRSRLESWDEVKVVSVFHLIGIGLEVYKVGQGSWSYPDDGFLRIGGVPLYSGFMYAAVASYITQAWRRFDLSMRPLPPGCIAIGLATAIYANFFTLHYLPDARWWLIALVLALYTRTKCFFAVNGRRYWLPLSLAFILIGLFIWIAENICTALGAWQYPSQEFAWTMVHRSKISSWFLLVLISYIVVAWLKDVKAVRLRKLGRDSC